ncbi:MAG: hypothetical protein ABSD87_10190 [Candidatus Acidiferrales bacterium]|jgi:hypothetical protein
MSIWRIAVGVFLGAIAAYICVGIFARVSAKIAVGERARVAHVVTAISPDDLIERCGKPLSDKPIAIATERKLVYNDAIFHFSEPSEGSNKWRNVGAYDITDTHEVNPTDLLILMPCLEKK